MKIRKIEVCGFKSFVDRTVIHIDHDVTAIVGPNGCGKSNIVDAIRWAMGEQSARHLRGKAMEDVIFNGSETRGPNSFAEVTLTFDNTEGLAPPHLGDYAEIAVTRRLDRDGTSEYLINKTPVRLMDVTQLFLGTGVGTKAYSIIEQGRIGFIVSAKPTDRRYLIEEAAGITKFKAKKKAAERKMDQTRQNLLRVGDIIGEIERSLASLKRQAQKAERYRRYRDEIRDLELLTASHRFMEMTVTARVRDAEVDRLEAELDGRRLALKVREAELSTERLGVQQAEFAVEQSQRVAFELDNTVKMLEGRIDTHLSKLETLREAERNSERELAAMRTQRTTLRAEAEHLRTALTDREAQEQKETELLALENDELERRRSTAAEALSAAQQSRARASESRARIVRAEAVLKAVEDRREESRVRRERLRTERELSGHREVELTQQAEALAARLRGLGTQQAQTQADRELLESELEALRARQRQSDAELERLRTEAAEKRSRLHSLTELADRLEGVGEGVRALMTEYAPDEASQKARGLLGMVADHLECPPELTSALASALGERLSHVVVSSAESADGALAFLKERSQGRATLVPHHPRRIIAPPPPLPAEAGVVGWLVDLVDFASEDASLAHHLLEGVLVVDSLETARRLHATGQSLGRSASFVTTHGECLRADGTISGGQAEDVGAHMIGLRREMRELSQLVGELDGVLDRAVTEHGELRNAIAERAARIDGARSEAHDVEIAIVKAEKDLRRAQEERELASERSKAFEKDEAELDQRLALASEEERDAQQEIEDAKEAEQEALRAAGAADEVHAGRRSAVEEQAQVVTSLKVRAAQAKERAEGDRAALGRVGRSIEELEARERRLRGDIERGAVQEGETAAQILLSRGDLSETVASAMRAHEELGAERSRYEQAKLGLGQREADLGSLRRQIEEANESLSEVTIAAREMAKDLEYLLATIDERHRVDLRMVIGDYHFRELPDAQVRARVDELLRLVERMGEINLTAIEEFEEKSTRYEYLTTQRDDLESALKQLERAIKEMNRESRRRFRETFDAVSARFRKVFPVLFGGGKAELTLTDPSDLLETGVEIMAQPPGKRLGSIELMSGGEKALTAVSLIFSIFQYRPSPFCLLDEVDAPLDEANIGRFSEAIRAMTKHSQFILITHAKSTMQMADVLYGVTMETPGISKIVSVELRKGENTGEESSAVA